MKEIIIGLILLLSSTSTVAVTASETSLCEENAFVAALQMEAIRPDAEDFNQPIKAVKKEQNQNNSTWLVTIEGNDIPEVTYIVTMDEACDIIEEPLRQVPTTDEFQQSQWTLKDLHYDPQAPFTSEVKIRTGYLPASPEVPFKGSILYLEGLGDSMMNHQPLFNTLTAAGFRVIAFDYMGQGGSTGTMNHTRIIDPLYPRLQISQIAEKVWDMYNQENPEAKKIILGWSTGGLAAYEMAHRHWADTFILMAPGICPEKTIGEGLKSWPPNQITLRTLTSAAPYSKEVDNPHIDSITPNTPVEVPLFALNLISIAKFSRHWKINPSIQGLVLLSGKKDSYVDSDCTREVIQSNTGFKWVQYEDALHEIDNEIPEIQQKMQGDILEFLENAILGENTDS